jgi:molybdenum cofactor cytidylyltransferase
MTSALLLCAGESRRLGQPKALLQFSGETLVARALEQLRVSGLGEIICVTGGHADEIEDEIFNFPAHIARNPAFQTGMLSSIQCGLRDVPESSPGALITLVDLPYLTAADYKAVGNFAPEHLVRYRYRGEPAHPVYVPRKYFAEILAKPQQQDGCAFLFQKYAQDVRWIEADSARGLLDIDTAEDYHAHLSS